MESGMALLEHEIRDSELIDLRTSEDAERAARKSLRAQIAKLERELAHTFVTAFPMGGIGHPERPPAPPSGAPSLSC